MEQTQYTEWEVMKALFTLPFDQLSGAIANHLVVVLKSLPLEQLKSMANRI